MTPGSRSSTPVLPIELLQRYDRPGPRYTSYPTAVEFHEGVDANTYASHLERAAKEASLPLSLLPLLVDGIRALIRMII